MKKVRKFYLRHSGNNFFLLSFTYVRDSGISKFLYYNNFHIYFFWPVGRITGFQISLRTSPRDNGFLFHTYMFYDKELAHFSIRDVRSGDKLVHKRGNGIFILLENQVPSQLPEKPQCIHVGKFLYVHIQ